MKTKRTLKPEFKFQIVLETLKEDRNQTEIARQYDIHPKLITNWKRQFLSEGPKIFKEKKGERKDKRIEKLEKIIGRQTIEIQFLKKVLGHLDQVIGRRFV